MERLAFKLTKHNAVSRRWIIRSSLLRLCFL